MDTVKKSIFYFKTIATHLRSLENHRTTSDKIPANARLYIENKILKVYRLVIPAFTHIREFEKWNDLFSALHQVLASTWQLKYLQDEVTK